MAVVSLARGCADRALEDSRLRDRDAISRSSSRGCPRHESAADGRRVAPHRDRGYDHHLPSVWRAGGQVTVGVARLELPLLARWQLRGLADSRQAPEACPRSACRGRPRGLGAGPGGVQALALRRSGGPGTLRSAPSAGACAGGCNGGAGPLRSWCTTKMRPRLRPPILSFISGLAARATPVRPAPGLPALRRRVARALAREVGRARQATPARQLLALRCSGALRAAPGALRGDQPMMPSTATAAAAN